MLLLVGAFYFMIFRKIEGCRVSNRTAGSALLDLSSLRYCSYAFYIWEL